MTFKKFILNEAVPLSLARKYLKNWDKERLKDWFDGKYRIYIPLQKVDINKITSEVERDIKHTLGNTDFEIKDYEKGVAFDTKNKREVRIGKVLAKFGYKDLLQSFNADPFRQGKSLKEELPIIVISRHPYDIIGQSYDRGWTSCKNLSTGINAKYLAAESKQTLVAYLIKQDDKNIKKPIARILAIPFIGEALDIKYILQKSVYGTAGSLEKSFVSTIQDWLDTKQGKLKGTYKASPYVYLDTLKSEYIFKDDALLDLPEWIIRSGNIPEAFEYIGDLFVWKRGTWESGTWKNGYWESGTWESGVWKNGYWESGTWEEGAWRQGTWIDGTWKNGFWNRGEWRRGLWKGGWILDKDKMGNYEPDWIWEGDYVRSPINPSKYFSGTRK